MGVDGRVNTGHTAGSSNTIIRFGQWLREIDVNAIVSSHTINLLHNSRPIWMHFWSSMATICTQTADKIHFIWRRIKWNIVFVVDVWLIGPQQLATPHKCPRSLSQSQQIKLPVWQKGKLLPTGGGTHI